MTIERPLYDERLERSIIGCMLLYYLPDAKHMAMIMDPDWFYWDRNRKIFKILAHQVEKGIAPDITLACQWLTREGCLGEVGGEEYLSECLGTLTTASQASQFVAELRRLSLDRRVVKSAARVQDAPTIENVEKLRQDCWDRDAADSGGVINLKETVAADVEKMVMPLERGLYDLGFEKMDKAFNGAMAGNVLTIAARPGVGKTVLGLTLMLYFARTYNEPILYFTTEMTYEETLMRLVALTTNVEAWRFRKRVFQQEHIKEIMAAIDIMRKLPIHIVDKPSPTIEDVRSAMLATKCRFVIVDYLQRMTLPKADSERQGLGMIMKWYKNILRDMGAVGTMVCQMDRETDYLTGKSKRPQLADLKGSGDIEQESDCVLLGWRHNKIDKETKKPRVPQVKHIRPIEWIFAKNRHGISDVSVQFIFEEKHIRFSEWTGEIPEGAGTPTFSGEADRVIKAQRQIELDGMMKKEQSRKQTVKPREAGEDPGEDGDLEMEDEPLPEAEVRYCSVVTGEPIGEPIGKPVGGLTEGELLAEMEKADNK